MDCEWSSQADDRWFSRFDYPSGYRVADLDCQIGAVSDAFGIDPAPALRLAKRLPALPERAEGWFAVPKIRFFGSHDKALRAAMAALSGQREVLIGFDAKRCCISRRKETAGAQKRLAEFQEGGILIFPAQFGSWYRKRGTEKSRELIGKNGNEFALGVFEVAVMLLANPGRIINEESLYVDCPGDIVSDCDFPDEAGLSPYFSFGNVDPYREALRLDLWLGSIPSYASGSASGLFFGSKEAG